MSINPTPFKIFNIDLSRHGQKMPVQADIDEYAHRTYCRRNLMLASTPNILLGTNFRLNTDSEVSLSNRKRISKSVLDSRENLLREF